MKFNSSFALRAVFVVWAVLWVFFLVRQNKKGQYEELAFFYSNTYDSKVEYLLGSGLSELLSFCAAELPQGATYDIRGFERFSIKEVRARYYLWPMRRVEDDPDLILIHGKSRDVPRGYRMFKDLGSKGAVYVKGAVR